MTVVSTVPLDFPLDSEIIHAIFSSIGRCTFMDEKHFDACTALSASGPAFVCLVLEAMADGGVMMGLPRTEALELAAQSRLMFHRCALQNADGSCHSSALQGTARMSLQSGAHPAQIKDSVTSKQTPRSYRCM
jgi:pyrroline-5-carboxylate reductase